jgi:hypothetical protein
MATQVQWRGGSTAEHATFTGAAREVTVDTQKQTLVVHNGSTAGGEALLREDQANLPGSVTNGIYTPGTNQVAVATNGVGRLFVDSTGVITTDAGITSSRFNIVNPNSVSTYDRLLAIRNGSLSTAFLGLGLDSFYIASASGSPMVFCTNSDGGVSGTSVPTNERLRIDSSGRLLVGTSTGSSVFDSVTPQLQVEGTSYNNSSASLFANTNDANGAYLIIGKSRGTSTGSSTIVNSNDAIGGLIFIGADGTDRNTPAAHIFAFADGTPGANDMPGRLVFSTTADGASSPTERMRITNGGSVFIGKTSGAGLGDVLGIDLGTTQGQALFVTGSTNILYLNRNTDDGDLIRFAQAGTNEGTISVSGTTVSYNGAHLSRWSQLSGIDPYNKAVRPEILRGTVMSNLDEMCEWTCPESGDCQDNEQLNKTKISDVAGDKNVAGIFQSWDDDDDTWVNDYYLAMTGDFVIRIAGDVTVERGDLLMSAGDGTAKPQDDDIIRSKTIAKVTSTNVSCTYDDGSYCVPCVLMAC